ncbi:nitroreductase family protein [Kitasatospora herbaricolor]|uniref:Nitroreductase family protein n=1 Tax=Kitasatospora herbaricolor TaxID=68217 RepID=A0ABZ1W9G1_9ACTN|nr:nitroreductase family protein [Kitasatospora herbaricolor]
MALPAAPSESPAEPAGAAGLKLALSLLEEGALTSRADRSRRSHGARAVPSAGAVYPYEFAVLTMENGEPAAFRVDADRRACTRLAAGDRVAEALHASALAIPADGGAVVVTLTRPWLSMRKYGDRGYLYTQLDAGHAAGNLLLATTGRGAPGTLRLRFPRVPLSDLLEAAENCREVHSVLLVPAAEADDAWTRWTVHDGGVPERRVPTWRSWLEKTCWDSLSARTEHPRTTPAADASAPLVQLSGTGRPAEVPGGLGDPSEWPKLLASRASSKAFVPGTVPAADVWQAVSALSTPVRTDLPAASPMGATLVLRSAEEPEHNAVHLLTGEGERLPGPLPTADEVVRACMQQRTLAGAAAVVLLHAPRTALSDTGSGTAAGAEDLRELAFRCGALGQLLYLGANRAQVGVTGVGGFDAALWHSLAGLPESDEILYVLLLGVPDDSGVKLDRLATAHAQNER